MPWTSNTRSSSGKKNKTSCSERRKSPQWSSRPRSAAGVVAPLRLLSLPHRCLRLHAHHLLQRLCHRPQHAGGQCLHPERPARPRRLRSHCCALMGSAETAELTATTLTPMTPSKPSSRLPRSRLLYPCCFGPSPLGPLLALCELIEQPKPLHAHLRLWSWCALGPQAHLSVGLRHRHLLLPHRNGKWSALGGLVASGASTSASLEFLRLQPQLLPLSSQLLLLLLLLAQLLQSLLQSLLHVQLLGMHDGEVLVPTKR